MENIIVAVDFSAVTDKLLQSAVKIASPRTKVYIIHVAAPDPDFIGLGVGPQYIRDDRATKLREEHALLGEYKDQLNRQGINAEALLIAGPTVETLLAEIEKLDAELIIIGRKGHSAIYEVLIGSVCKDILEKLKVPALLVPDEEGNAG